jgi:hypothetical protein
MSKLSENSGVRLSEHKLMSGTITKSNMKMSDSKFSQQNGKLTTISYFYRNKQ